MSKSPSRFKNQYFSPNQSRGRNKNAGYSSNFRSPNGRNLQDSFNTINQSHGGMQSIDMGASISTINNYMVYPRDNMGNSFNDMSQHTGPEGQNYMLSMSTNINVGIVNNKDLPNQKMQRKQQNNMGLKKNLQSRGNYRTKNKRRVKPQGIKDYYNSRVQDSQNFSRINRSKVQESLAAASGLFSPDETTEPFEHKPIDSQIGPLRRERDYSVDRAGMRNRNANAGLASLVLSPGADPGMSHGPGRPLLNDSVMFKSTNGPGHMAGAMFNTKSVVGALSGRPGVSSPGKDSRNIKLDPINMGTFKCILVLSLWLQCCFTIQCFLEALSVPKQVSLQLWLRECLLCPNS